MELDIEVSTALGWSDFVLSPVTGESMALPRGKSRPKSGNTSNHSLVPKWSKDANLMKVLLDGAMNLRGVYGRHDVIGIEYDGESYLVDFVGPTGKKRGWAVTGNTLELAVCLFFLEVTKRSE